MLCLAAFHNDQLLCLCKHLSVRTPNLAIQEKECWPTHRKLPLAHGCSSCMLRGGTSLWHWQQNVTQLGVMSVSNERTFFPLTICRCITYNVILFKTVVIHLISFFRETTSNCCNQQFEILVPKLWVLRFTVVNGWKIQLVSANKQLMPPRSWPCAFLLSDVCVWSDSALHHSIGYHILK